MTHTSNGEGIGEPNGPLPQKALRRPQCHHQFNDEAAAAGQPRRIQLPSSLL